MIVRDAQKIYSLDTRDLFITMKYHFFETDTETIYFLSDPCDTIHVMLRTESDWSSNNVDNVVAVFFIFSIGVLFLFGQRWDGASQVYYGI